MLTNFDLDDISKHYGFTLNAVVMKDELKTLSPKNGNYIINLESSSQGDGTHWLCCVVRGKQCFYLDPFGILPPTEVIDFCRRIHKSHLAYSTFEIQNINADTCGWFGCGLLIYLHDNPNKDFANKIRLEGISTKDLKHYKTPNYVSMIKAETIYYIYVCMYI